MEREITDLVTRFETGTLSRRQLIAGLTMLAAGGTSMPLRAQSTPFKSTRIDHVSIQTTDLARSVEFYEKIFGLKILNEDKANEIARMGVTRTIVSLHHKQPFGKVDHFAIAVDDFNPKEATKTLAAQGLKAETNLDYGFYIRDPNGMPVQLVKT